jgi:hypothetical protein
LKQESLVLANVCDGKIAELFNDAIGKIVVDIAERPTNQDKRTITIKVELTPDESGYLTQVGEVKYALPGNRVGGIGIIGDRGEVKQLRNDQPDLPGIGEENVIEIKRKEVK